MFTWYSRAKICYIYLADVSHYNSSLPENDRESFVRSRWFKRGWTLQELIAPQALSFYTRDWIYIGDKKDLAEDLHTATGIELDVLMQNKSFRDCSIAQRMSWASNRETARDEDIAYCLIGLFNVNMSLRYGESSKAFLRLQEIIIQETDDETIFAWTGVAKEGSGLLAPSPANFSDSSDIKQSNRHRERPPYKKFNRGLQIECEILPCEMNTYVVPLQCERIQVNSEAQQIAIFLCKTLKDNQYRRVSFQGKCIDEVTKWQISKAATSTVFVPSDAYTVELAPRVGFPVVRIKSKLYPWQLPKVVIDPLLKISPQYWNAIAANEPDLIRTQDEWESVLSQLSPEVPWVRDLENGTTQRRSTTDCDPKEFRWMPKKLQKQFQFQFRHLESGILIAFTRSDSSRWGFEYLLEIGFDIKFMPVCILHTVLFQLENKGPIPLFSYKYTNFPTHGSFWNMNKSSHWSPPLSLYRADIRNAWKATGNTHAGLNLYIHDMLPRHYGCVNVRLTLRPVKSLEWELVVTEEPLHSGVYEHGFFCLSRNLQLFFSLVNISWWMVLLIILLVVVIYFSGLILQGILSIGFDEGVSLAAFIILSPCFLQILLITRPTGPRNRKFRRKNHGLRFVTEEDQHELVLAQATSQEPLEIS